MPTYAYACTACDHRFDAVQSIKDDALTDCPECAGTLRRVIGAVGVSFKGSGFYRTDSRAAAKVSAKGAGPKDAGSAGSGSSVSSTKDAAAKSSGSADSSAKPKKSDAAAGS